MGWKLTTVEPAEAASEEKVSEEVGVPGGVRKKKKKIKVIFWKILQIPIATKIQSLTGFQKMENIKSNPC